jgi:hypothetical protein
LPHLLGVTISAKRPIAPLQLLKREVVLVINNLKVEEIF